MEASLQGPARAGCHEGGLRWPYVRNIASCLALGAYGQPEPSSTKGLIRKDNLQTAGEKESLSHLSPSRSEYQVYHGLMLIRGFDADGACGEGAGRDDLIIGAGWGIAMGR